MIILSLLLLSLVLASTFAQDVPWLLGDENTVACFTSTSYTNSSTPTAVNVAGIDFGFVNKLNTTLTANVPLNSTIRLNLQNTFYTGNKGIFLPDPSSDLFNQLCLRHVNPQNPTQESCMPPISNDTCCVTHVNWHFCSMSLMTGNECMPWVNTTAKNILITGTPALHGSPGQSWDSGSFALDTPDRYIILAHFKMGNVQCAVGAMRTVVPQPTSVSSPTPSATGSPSSLSTGAVAGIAVGGAGVLAIAALAFTIIYRKRRKDNDRGDHGTGSPGSMALGNGSQNSLALTPMMDPASTPSNLKPATTLTSPYTPPSSHSSPVTTNAATVVGDNHSIISSGHPYGNQFVYPNQQQPVFMPYGVDNASGQVYSTQPYPTQPYYAPVFYQQPQMQPQMQPYPQPFNMQSQPLISSTQGSPAPEYSGISDKPKDGSSSPKTSTISAQLHKPNED